jgi:hypothetical protein
MYFYAAVVGLNIGYAIAMLYLGEYGIAAFNSGMAAIVIGIKYYG